MPELNKEEWKQVVKEALQEWLDKQFSSIGVWTVRGLAAAVFAMLVYYWLTLNGWHK